MSNFIEEIVFKLNPKQIGEHLKIYLNLYLHPFESWKKSISLRKEGFDFIVMQLIYYTIILFIALQNLQTSIQIVIIDVLATLVPFLFFIIPFVLFVRLFKKRTHWTKLFRLILIIKLQFIPPILILILAAKKGNIESLYLINSNLIWVLWLSMIVVIPIVFKLRILQKIMWIFTNYIFFLIGIVVFGLMSKQLFEGNKYVENLLNISPQFEFHEFQSKSTYFPLKVKDNKCLFVFSKENGKFQYWVQFVSYDLLLEFTRNQMNSAIIELYKSDSINCLMDKNYTRKSKKYVRDSNIILLTKNRLDSFKINNTKDFQSDLNLSFLMKDSAKFQSNRDYFKSYHEYLCNYKNVFANTSILLKTLRSNNNPESLIIDSNTSAVILQIDSLYFGPYKSKMLEMQKILEKRYERSELLANIILYPVILIANLFDS